MSNAGEIMRLMRRKLEIPTNTQVQLVWVVRRASAAAGIAAVPAGALPGSRVDLCAILIFY